MAKSAVTKRQLGKVEGLDEVKKQIEARIDRVMGDALKDVYIDAAKVVWSAAKTNIAALPVGTATKEMLSAQVSIMRGKPKQPRVVVGMSQKAGKRKLGGAHRSWNPYWNEFGTQERRTQYNHPIYGTRRGRIKPTPFFVSAVKASKTAVRDRIAEGFKSLVVEMK